MSQGEIRVRVLACFRKPDPKVLSVKRSDFGSRSTHFDVAGALGRHSKDNDVPPVPSDKKGPSKAAGWRVDRPK